MGGASARKALEGHLASLLGFDEVSDVFDHLVTIETEDDLLEYLSALLGLDGAAVGDFVDDIWRFQRREELVNISVIEENSEAGNSTVDTTQVDATSKPAATSARKEREEKKVEQELAALKLEDSTNPRREQKQKSKADTAVDTVDKRTRLNDAREQKQQQKEKKADDRANEAAGRSAGKSAAEAVSEPTRNIKETRKADVPKLPQKGKASVVCGCFGTVHKPLTNCLHCGRIACETEGYGFCGFCGYLIEKVAVAGHNRDGKFDKALLHKERLLKFDREFTKRTHVYDDQADYFSNTTSTWLDERERNDAEEKDEARRKDIHERKKHTLTLDL